MESKETKMFGVKLDKDIHKKFKMMSVDKNMDMRTLIHQIIEKEIERYAEEVERYAEEELEKEPKENENSLLLEAKKDFVRNEQLTI